MLILSFSIDPKLKIYTSSSNYFVYAKGRRIIYVLYNLNKTCLIFEEHKYIIRFLLIRNGPFIDHLGDYVVSYDENNNIYYSGSYL